MIRMVGRSVVGLQNLRAEAVAGGSFVEAAEVVDESDIVGAAVAAGFGDDVVGDGVVVEYRHS
jgi:hypothetical protein